MNGDILIGLIFKPGFFTMALHHRPGKGQIKNFKKLFVTWQGIEPCTPIQVNLAFQAL